MESLANTYHDNSVELIQRQNADYLKRHADTMAYLLDILPGYRRDYRGFQLRDL
jgi:hypothetical protein